VDCKQVVSVGADRCIRRWSRDEGRALSPSSFETIDDLNLVQILASGEFVVAGEEGKVILVDTQCAGSLWESTGSLPATYADNIQALCLIRWRERECIFFGNGTGDLGYISVRGHVLACAHIPGTIECGAVNGDNSLIYLGMSDGTVCRVRATDLAVLERRRLHDTTVKAIAVSPSGTVATSSYDGQLLFCDPGLKVTNAVDLGNQRFGDGHAALHLIRLIQMSLRSPRLQTDLRC
jgi:WD40 repeat protein